jgi:hypothetical protein
MGHAPTSFASHHHGDSHVSFFYRFYSAPSSAIMAGDRMKFILKQLKDDDIAINSSLAIILPFLPHTESETSIRHVSLFLFQFPMIFICSLPFFFLVDTTSTVSSETTVNPIIVICVCVCVMDSAW